MITSRPGASYAMHRRARLPLGDHAPEHSTGRRRLGCVSSCPRKKGVPLTSVQSVAGLLQSHRVSLAAKGHPTVHKGGNTRTARTIRRETDDILPLAPTTMYHGKHNTRERRRKLSSLLTHTLPPSHPHTLTPSSSLVPTNNPTIRPRAQYPGWNSPGTPEQRASRFRRASTQR